MTPLGFGWSHKDISTQLSLNKLCGFCGRLLDLDGKKAGQGGILGTVNNIQSIG